jgi:hypothetical protein
MKLMILEKIRVIRTRAASVLCGWKTLLGEKRGGITEGAPKKKILAIK